LLHFFSEGWILNPAIAIVSDMMFKEEVNNLFYIYHKLHKLLFHKDKEGPSYAGAPLISTKHSWKEYNRIQWNKAETIHKEEKRTESL
jgi:hypothetical protein